MTPQTRAVSPSPSVQETRRRYRNPSVHEVVLDLLFDRSLTEQEVEDLARVTDRFGVPGRLEKASFGFKLEPNSPIQTREERHLHGWQFARADSPIIIRVQSERLALNMVRSPKWPRGEYVGWEQIFASFSEMLDVYSSFYARLKPRRLGLRYLNKLALPVDVPLQEWLNIGLHAPPILQKPFTFQLRQTWSELEAFPDMSVTLGLSRITVDDEPVDGSRLGVLLDVDVFSLDAESAPPYSGVREWFTRAHEAENAIFEACITDRSRLLFDGGL